ncbi:MAG: hypothetical protein JO369_08580 [Paucibacter sp.]|nr:hypothetical protein [Roseateles sp.]
MKSWKLIALMTLAGLASGAWAQAPADAPAGSTGVCKDGSYTSNATKKGACAGHHGVKTWFAAAAAPAAAPAPAASAAPAAATAPAAKATAAAKPAAAATPAAPGDVWVNTPTKVYHCPGTKWYGKTKQGEYMSESAAKAAGNHADHGKACS